MQVNLASSCSHSLWREACAAFASQLSESDPVKSASCRLMLGEVLEAVDVLRKKGAFRMAVAVAKARLPAETPLVRELYREWAAASAANGRTALAARCHAAAGDDAAGQIKIIF